MMAMPASVLRLLLCIALVLNGLGDAVAATRMLLSDTAGHQARAAAMAEATAPCHPAGSEAPHAHDAPDCHQGHQGQGGDASGCCSASGPACACDCMHTAHFVLPPSSAGPVAMPAPPAPMHAAPVHVPPALRHPIRPPIG